GATTQGLGEVLRTIVERPAGTPPEILVGLGGSASTDGGTGLLTALGARFLDATGAPLPPGGGSLRRLARIDWSGLVRPGPITVLSDVTAPLLGAEGAAAVFGPQKGATEADIEALDAGLARLADVVGADPWQPGMGAAGGTAYALVGALQARLVPGAPYVAAATGLVTAARSADVLITGEGKVDATSDLGKTVGHALGLAGPSQRIVIGGAIDTAPAGCRAYSLTDLAGSTHAAMGDPQRWLIEAGRRAATDVADEPAS
ncbi:MAG: glycerate kinase, partial [Propionibacteriaceae bacterium]|nr:glycerate kinase [Propionibacteriaceae bacterium]